MHNFQSNWVQIDHLPQKRFFGKIDCYYCIPTVLLHAATSHKNPQRAHHKIKIPKLEASYFPKREFYGKVDQYIAPSPLVNFLTQRNPGETEIFQNQGGTWEFLKFSLGEKLLEMTHQTSNKISE